MNRIFQRTVVITCALVAVCVPMESARAQSQPTAHRISLSGVMQSIDAQGRIVLVASAAGDLPGVLTLAMSVGPDGRVTAGEWALSVSYNQLGAMTADGSAASTLVQQGTFKGGFSGGFAQVGANGLMTDINGLQLAISSATLQFATVTAGSGIANGNHMNLQSASNGTVTLTF